MKYLGFITVENCSTQKEFEDIASLILDEFSNMELSIIEDNEYYFVIKFTCEEFEEIQELSSIIAYILTGEHITKYSITINYND